MSQRLSRSTWSISSCSGGGHRIGDAELLQQALVALDVARLVDHLGRGVELGIDVRHLGDDLGGADQRALLALHELADLPALEVAAHLGLLLAATSPRTRPCR